MTYTSLSTCTVHGVLVVHPSNIVCITNCICIGNRFLWTPPNISPLVSVNSLLIVIDTCRINPGYLSFGHMHTSFIVHVISPIHCCPKSHIAFYQTFVPITVSISITNMLPHKCNWFWAKPRPKASDNEVNELFQYGIVSWSTPGIRFRYQLSSLVAGINLHIW